MNNDRRKRIAEIQSKVEELSSQFDSLMSEIEDVLSEEQECLDNMPENLQQSERYRAMGEAVSNLEYAQDACANLSSYAEECSQYLKSASE